MVKKFMFLCWFLLEAVQHLAEAALQTYKMHPRVKLIILMDRVLGQLS